MLKLLGSGRYTVAELAEDKDIKFSTRKIYYFLANVLDEYVKNELRKTPNQGKTTYYPEQVLNRLKLIQMALDELTRKGVKFNYTRTELKKWMNGISDEEVSRVLSDAEPLVFGYQKQENGKQITETLDGEKLSPDSEIYGRQIPPEEYVAPKSEKKSVSNVDKKWNTLKLAEDCELRYRGEFSKSRHAQLTLLADLLKSMLDKEV